MATTIVIQRLDGGILCPSALWKSRARAKNNYTQITTFVGSGPAFELNSELQKLQGVMTKYGVYRDHTVVEGSPGIYDQVTLNFQALLNPPQYVYDFNAPTKSFSLGTHPSYKTFWDHDIIDTNASGDPATIDATELNLWQSISNTNPVSTSEGGTAGLTWAKNNQAISNKANIAKTNATTLATTSGHASCRAMKPGVNAYIYPAVSVRETIYFVEKREFTFTIAGVDFTAPLAVNTKTIASMGGKAGWPLRTQFGYPRDVYTLLNDSDYSDYLAVGVDNNGNVISVDEDFFVQRGIPTDDYLGGAGHPLWICTNCTMKKVGYWFEATLLWEYYGFGVDADLYPISTARTSGIV